VFVATGASTFGGSRAGARSELRVNSVLHVNRVLPPDTDVPIGWIAAGDRVFLLRRADGGLVRVGHARPDADGSVSFAVKARATRTTYVVKLPSTRTHGLASTTVTVAVG
jgi:hypothetical protein